MHTWKICRNGNDNEWEIRRDSILWDVASKDCSSYDVMKIVEEYADKKLTWQLTDNGGFIST